MAQKQDDRKEDGLSKVNVKSESGKDEKDEEDELDRQLERELQSMATLKDEDLRPCTPLVGQQSPSSRLGPRPLILREC